MGSAKSKSRKSGPSHANHGSRASRTSRSVVGASPAAAPDDYAGAGARVVAFVLDSAIIGFGAFLLSLILAIPGRSIGGGFGALLIVADIVIVIAGWAWYWGELDGVRGQTVGKKAMGIRLVSSKADEPIGFAWGVGRAFFQFFSAAVFYLGDLWMLWDDQRQTWHDKLASSVVVHA